MKQVLIFLFILSYSWCHSQYGTIKGTIKSKSGPEPFINAYLLDSLYTNNKIGAISDFDGLFLIDSIPPGNYYFKISGFSGKRGFLDTTIQNVKIKPDTVLYFNINIHPCKYDKKNKICPLCKKKNNVIPIAYGYPSPKLIESASKKKVYLGGCVISGCDPNWYCKKDKTKF